MPNFCKMRASWHWTPSLPKPYILTFPQCRFGAVFQSYLWCCSPGCSPHFAPNKTYLTTLKLYIFFSQHNQSVQLLSCVQLFVTPWTAACQGSLSTTNSQSLLKLMSIALVMPSNNLILCCPLLLPSIFPSIRVFSNELVLHIRWPK